MIRILVAEDFDLLREDLCDTLSQQQDMEVAGLRQQWTGHRGHGVVHSRRPHSHGH